MRPKHSVYVLLLSIQSAYAAQCAAPPLVLPIRTASVAPGVISNGIPILLGTPPQQFVLTPSLQLDTPFIPRYTNSCIYTANDSVPANVTKYTDQDGRNVCMGIYGGGFVPEQSTTFLDNGMNSPVSEAWFKKSRYSDWHFVTDDFVFADYVTAYAQQNDVLPQKRNVTTSFILSNEGATFGGLGVSMLSLTPGSQLLETLVTEGLIPSRSWSLSNGSLCLGCLDVHAYTGGFQRFKVADREKNRELPCTLQVKVESLDYHHGPTSEGTPLIESGFTACVDPGVPFLVFPPDTREALGGAAGADWVSSSKRPSDSSGSFLRFKLEGGLEVDVGKPSNITASAASVFGQEVSIEDGTWGAYGQDVPVLGQPFTTSVILKWDQAMQEYGLANKNSKSDARQDLKPLGCDRFPSVKEVTEAIPNAGVIVGSMIGGFVTGLLFAAAAIFFYWRGQRGVRSKYEAMRGEDTVSLRTVDTGSRTLESRMSGISGLPATSLRESLRSHFEKRSISPIRQPYLVGDSQVFEAPEGGTAEPSKRSRGEMMVYSYHHR